MDNLNNNNNNNNNKKKRNIAETNQKVRDVINEATNMDSRFDPNGSYTGQPLEPGEIPVQDADDL